MKVSKKSIKSSNIVPTVESLGKYSCCIENIQSAIDCLCQFGPEDEKAKEAVANLSVVLLDLKSE